MTDQRLLRHLIVAIVVKLAALAGLWWWLVRDARVSVDADAAAAWVTAPASGAAHPPMRPAMTEKAHP